MIRKYAEIFCWKNVSSFCSAKATHIFSAKNIRILYIESAKTVNEMTLNELVKLTTLWTTGPSLSYSIDIPACYNGHAENSKIKELRSSGMKVIIISHLGFWIYPKFLLASSYFELDIQGFPSDIYLRGHNVSIDPYFSDHMSGINCLNFTENIANFKGHQCLWKIKL